MPNNRFRQQDITHSPQYSCEADVKQLQELKLTVWEQRTPWSTWKHLQWLIFLFFANWTDTRFIQSADEKIISHFSFPEIGIFLENDAALNVFLHKCLLLLPCTTIIRTMKLTWFECIILYAKFIILDAQKSLFSCFNASNAVKSH